MNMSIRKNPFNISFGKIPSSIISRSQQLDEIENDFLESPHNSQIYIFTGVRGSGKTVALTSMIHSFTKYDDWIVICINPVRNTLADLAAKLHQNERLKDIFHPAAVELSFFGANAQLQGRDQNSNASVDLDRMIDKLTKEKH